VTGDLSVVPGVTPGKNQSESVGALWNGRQPVKQTPLGLSICFFLRQLVYALM
jgi:hypothetical protein